MSTVLASVTPPSPTSNSGGTPCSPRPRQCLSLLELCRQTTEFEQTHAAIVKLGLIRHPLFFTRLAAFCSLSPAADPAYARRLFDLDPCPNTFAYNVMIRGHALHRQHEAALALFAEMLRRGTPAPNSLTFPFVLKSCSALGAAEEGRMVHAMLYKSGLNSDLFIQNALILNYAQCGHLSDALKMFDIMPVRDVVSWNTMMDGLVDAGLMEDARRLFDEMPERSVASWNCLVNGYVKSGLLSLAREAFDKAPVKNLISWNTMIGGYAGGGMMGDACKLFRQTPMKDLKTLTVMIDGYAKTCRYDEVLGVFNEMLDLEIEPNVFALVNALSACSHLAVLEMGEWVHGYVDRCRIKLDSVLGTALVDMYAKCGRIEQAIAVFSRMEDKDVGAWNCMIAGLGVHGYGREALVLFFKMMDKLLLPNEVTFLSILSACRHSGLIDDGRKCFYLMTEVYGLVPKSEHYGCMADLLCRAGLLNEAKELIEATDAKLNVQAWAALLGASSRIGCMELGEYAAEHLLELDPHDAQCYMVLANMYSKGGRWEDALEARKKMRDCGMEKLPGCSSIEVNGVVYEFGVGGGLDPLD